VWEWDSDDTTGRTEAIESERRLNDVRDDSGVAIQRLDEWPPALMRVLPQIVIAAIGNAPQLTPPVRELITQWQHQHSEIVSDRE
jgi:hypothetical protein